MQMGDLGQNLFLRWPCQADRIGADTASGNLPIPDEHISVIKFSVIVLSERVLLSVQAYGLPAIRLCRSSTSLSLTH